MLFCVEPIRITQFGRASIYMLIPAWFRNANHLRNGDYLMVDLSQVRIVRKEDLATLAEEPVAVAAEVP
jgi:hypothetical protein